MRKRRALLYDNDPMVLDFFQDLFTSMNYEVISLTTPVVCPHSGERVDTCTNPCADILLTDCRIPGKYILKLLAEQTAKNCKIPVRNKAVMSTFVDDEFRKTLAETGFAFFQKPILLSELYDWISLCEHRSDLSQSLSPLRKSIRHETTYNIQCRVDRTGQTLDATIINMSDDGLCLQSATPLMVSDRIHIQTKPPLISCRTASVRWTNQNGTGSYRAGLLCE